MQTKSDLHPVSRLVLSVITSAFRHRRAALVTSIAILLGATAAILARPREYQSEMKILINRERMDPVMTSTPNAQTQARADITEEEMYSEVELLKSRDLLESVVARTGLNRRDQPSWFQASGADDPGRTERATRALDRALDIAPLKKTTLIRVAYTDRDPRLAAQVLTALADRYLEKHMAVHRPAGAFEFFQAQTERYRKALQDAEARLVASAGSATNASAEGERVLTLQKQADFEASLQSARVEFKESSKRLSELRRIAAATSPRMTTVTRASDNGELVRELKSRVLTLELKRTELLTKFTPTYRPVVELDKELEQARAALADAHTTPLNETSTDRNPIFQWTENEIAKNRADAAGARARANALHLTVQRYRNRGRSLERDDVERQDLVRAVKTAEESYLLYARKQEEARISDALDRTRIANVAIVQPPQVPVLPSTGGRALMLVAALMLAMTGGLLVGYAIDRLRPSLRTPDDVERWLDVPVLATVPAEAL